MWSQVEIYVPATTPSSKPSQQQAVGGKGGSHPVETPPVTSATTIIVRSRRGDNRPTAAAKRRSRSAKGKARRKSARPPASALPDDTQHAFPTQQLQGSASDPLVGQLQADAIARIASDDVRSAVQALLEVDAPKRPCPYCNLTFERCGGPHVPSFLSLLERGGHSHLI